MAELLLFKPKSSSTPEKNLADFIKMCRNELRVFGDSLDWDSNAWPGVHNFTKLGASSRGFTDNQLLDKDIMHFAKAYVRYQQGHNPTKLKNEIKAIRCIEPALLKLKGEANILLVDIAVLDEAVIFAKAAYRSSSYQAGIQLQRLIQFLNKNYLLLNPISWKNPLSKPHEINRTSSDVKRRRQQKIPPNHVLDYMAEMFANELQAPRDIYVTSTFALMLCVPGRNMEFHDLPVNCLHREKDSKGRERLGLRFVSGKGYGADIKWIPTSMVEIAEEAVRRLTELTKPARKLAEELEKKPDCSTHSLPTGWPWKNREKRLKWSQALYCMRKNELHDSKPTSSSELWTPGKSAFTFDLTERPQVKSHRSIWARHGYTNPDGSKIRFTSHQLRHYLNTIAQRGELGQLDIAKWSGRANIHQNRTYNHISEDELLDKVKSTAALLPMSGPLGKIESHSPVTLKDLDAVGEGIAHITEFGFCVHDYSMVPCQKHRDCLNCSEQVCVKGDDEKLKRLKEHREAIATQLKMAQEHSLGGYYGADRWSEHQQRTLERADQLIMLLESTELPDSTVIRLNKDSEYSPLKREISANAFDRKSGEKQVGSIESPKKLGGDIGKTSD